MRSGIVYFEEILEGVKDGTGIENINPFIEKIKRSIFNAETDIGPGGLITRLSKTYTLNDGEYDGTYLTLPYNLIFEDSLNGITTGDLHGNKLKLKETPGPEEVILKYMGFVLDQNGNPVTSRNRFEAIIARCIFDLYRPKKFLGIGNRGDYLDYKNDYDNKVLAARGYDAFPTEQEWEYLGQTISMSYKDLIMIGNNFYGSVSIGNEQYYTENTGSTIIDMVPIFNSNLS